MNELYSKYLASKGVTTDSRNIKKGCMFFALKGESFDGNLFANQAIEQGASYAVVDNPGLVGNLQCILVHDVLESLQQLAAFHRSQLQIPVIGITGTNGKTSTKELITSVLSQKYNVHATRGNLNNHIGVPLTILGIKPETEIAVIEMGANHSGEIAFLCNIARPDFGIITNIGTAHIEGFGSLQGVINAKSELYNYIRMARGSVFVNSDDDLLMNLSVNIQRELYGSNSQNIQGKMIDNNPFLEIELQVFEKKQQIETHLIGGYNLNNILAAACIGHYFGVSTDAVALAIEGYKPQNLRSQFLVTEHNKLIVDAYNANPSSMDVALKNFNDVSGDCKVLIIGEMLELGKLSEQEHTLLLAKIEKMQKDMVLLVGKSFINSKIPDGFLWFENVELLKAHLQKNPLAGKLILLKGSRGNKLEKLLDVL